MTFDENVIKFEAAFDSPISVALLDVELEKWIDVLDVVVEDVKRYAKDNNTEVCRKVWVEYKNQADWTELGEKILAKQVKQINEKEVHANKFTFIGW